MTSQAQRIFDKFGSAKALERALRKIGKERHILSIQSWTRVKDDRGTGGVIPTHNWPDILKAARVAGVKITDADMDPRPTN
jgi:hypothetical protein